MASLSSAAYEGVKRMSESVFVGFCHKIGTSELVAMRRDMTEISEMVKRQGEGGKEMISMLSGSTREGFRLKESDVDLMFWFNDHQVIWDLCRTQFHNINGKTLILSDCSESPPGFSLLQILTPTRYRQILNACVRRNDRTFISSSAYRQQTCSREPKISTLNGPCGNGNVMGKEFDFAYCLASDLWPPSASSWIDRCITWPPTHVLNDIVNNGCHLVPIGHPLGLHQSEEWRISFSLAELKLVCAMNHCQFLTYGLLKVFLKEAINQSEDTDKLLCSYHMKTTLFWVIQRNMIPYWCPQNLLECFWVCFKVILQWVYEGICPNFFIPKNNMFLVKIYGSAQKRLFLKLHTLYKTGLASLLQSPTIRSHIIHVLYNPRLSICTNERYMTSEVDFDTELFSDMVMFDLRNADFQHCLKYLQKIEELVGLPLTKYKVVRLQSITASVFQLTAFMMHKKYVDTGVNKLIYIADKVSCYMLKLGAKFGFISDMLHLAMYYYKTFRYQEALSVIEMTKVKLTQPYVMYRLYVDPEKYIQAVGGQSWSTKMRKAVAQNTVLLVEICYINELVLEQQYSKQGQLDTIFIPPSVLLHMLDFLCSRHIDATRALSALDDLQFLVHHDQGSYVPVRHRDLTWQILGICQQMSGNLTSALYSYQQSLRQYPFHKIQTATLMRMLGIKTHSVLASRGK
ncbi:uncharacterized protein LOC133200946 [Saccostrea echinata]|uniref:uncharacterized protein LOC133200946 n=1 Tax=Saccostrea echinata TaxID=191078 RepID=UPI002A81420E|nr:uncharacterized protein LOC133200946 [Saccostrea echinata]